MTELRRIAANRAKMRSARHDAPKKSSNPYFDSHGYTCKHETKGPATQYVRGKGKKVAPADGAHCRMKRGQGKGKAKKKK